MPSHLGYGFDIPFSKGLAHTFYVVCFDTDFVFILAIVCKPYFFFLFIWQTVLVVYNIRNRWLEHAAYN